MTIGTVAAVGPAISEAQLDQASGTSDDPTSPTSIQTDSVTLSFDASMSYEGPASAPFGDFLQGVFAGLMEKLTSSFAAFIGGSGEIQDDQVPMPPVIGPPAPIVDVEDAEADDAVEVVGTGDEDVSEVADDAEDAPVAGTGDEPEIAPDIPERFMKRVERLEHKVDHMIEHGRGEKAAARLERFIEKVEHRFDHGRIDEAVADYIIGAAESMLDEIAGVDEEIPEVPDAPVDAPVDEDKAPVDAPDEVLVAPAASFTAELHVAFSHEAGSTTAGMLALSGSLSATFSGQIPL